MSTPELSIDMETGRPDDFGVASKHHQRVGFAAYSSTVIDEEESAEQQENNNNNACEEFHRMGYERTKDFMDDARCPETEASKKKSAKKRQEDSFQCWPCRSWSRERARLTAMGCTSSCLVLAIRLYLDREPLAYLIHSIIVFLDMILIHLFTNTWWLSLSGELVTYASFLLFHFEKETVYELLETTLIAVLCSFQMIASRSQVKDDNQKLRGDLRQLRRQTVLILRRSTIMDEADVTASELDYIIEETKEAVAAASAETNLNVNSSARNVVKDWFLQHNADPEEVREKAVLCGERFFEHFLDGSAGVMYTSFLGLIITELVRYGESSY